MNTFGKIVVAVVVVLGLAGLAYYFVPRWFPEPSPNDGIDLIVSEGPLTMTEVVQTRHADVEGTVGCDVRLLYPQVAEEQSANISSEAREKINEAITKQVTDFLSTNTASLDESATAFVTSCQEDLTEFVTDLDDPMMSAQQAWVSEIGYDMKLNDGKYLSLGIANYLSTGGAHPNTTELFLTFDVTTGDIVTIREVLSEDRFLSFEQDEKQWLVNNMKDQLFEESTMEFEVFLALGTQEQAEKYLDDVVFYLTPNDIVTFYNPYVIAPYVVGPIEVVLAR